MSNLDSIKPDSFDADKLRTFYANLLEENYKVPRLWEYLDELEDDFSGRYYEEASTDSQDSAPKSLDEALHMLGLNEAPTREGFVTVIYYNDSRNSVGIREFDMYSNIALDSNERLLFILSNKRIG